MSPLSHSSWHSCMLEFVIDRGPGAGERSGGQFEDALCGPNKRRQTEWRKLMIDAFYPHPPIDESHIDAKAHAERVDRLSRIDPQTFTAVQYIALKQTPQTRRALISLSSLAVLISFFLPAVYAANIGTVVPVMGIVADLIYDSARNLVYLANSSRSEVDIYSVGERRLVGSVVTGTLPSSLALSPDLSTLYVASAGSNTINTINLSTRQRGNDYNVGPRPDAIAVGNHG